jgi:hypothetical protein
MLDTRVRRYGGLDALVGGDRVGMPGRLLAGIMPACAVLLVPTRI